MNLRMSDSVQFQEMVFTAIPSNLKLRPEPNHSPSLLSLGYGLLDVVDIAIKVHSPLVQIAGCNFQQPHLLCTQQRL